jgi:hypothetical protein
VISYNDYLLLGLVGVTSALAYAVGAFGLGLSRRALAPALAHLLDVVGLVVVFYLANVAMGALVLVAARHLAHRVVSLYMLNDLALVMLSVLQAIAFRAWRAAGTRDDR